jgi:hypothetical protein
MAKNNFLAQLERRRQTHFKQASSHVDKPREETLEELEAKTKRAELEKLKAETGYWEDRRQQNAGGGDEPVFGLASNNRKFFKLPKRKRPYWR